MDIKTFKLKVYKTNSKSNQAKQEKENKKRKQENDKKTTRKTTRKTSKNVNKFCWIFTDIYICTVEILSLHRKGDSYGQIRLY